MFQNHKLLWATYHLITRMFKDSTDDYKNEINSASHWLYFLIQRSQKYFYIINLSKFSPTTANFLVSFKSSLGVIWRDFSKYSSQNICSRTSKKFLQIFFYKNRCFFKPTSKRLLSLWQGTALRKVLQYSYNKLLECVPIPQRKW